MVETFETFPFLALRGPGCLLVWRWKARQGWRSGFRASSAVATFFLLFFVIKYRSQHYFALFSRERWSKLGRFARAALVARDCHMGAHCCTCALPWSDPVLPSGMARAIASAIPYFCLGSSSLLKRGFR